MYLFRIKRFFDFFAAILSLLFLSPLLFVICLAIFFTDRGPVLFIHKRIGRNGSLFSFYKFRSMPVDTPKVPSAHLYHVKLSFIGKLIRRTSIDELPQLFNILLGDMSFVGPRPSLPNQTYLFSLRQESGALSLRPGLTGLAQVRSFDGMSDDQKAFFDATYFKNVSLLMDFRIIVRTFYYLIKSPPIY